MTKVSSTHPEFPWLIVNRAAAWVMRGLELPATSCLTLHVAPKARAHAGWNARYWTRRRAVEVFIGRQVSYPTPLGHTKGEGGWHADDPLELLVVLLAHELEHCRVHTAAPPHMIKTLNRELRVRSVSFRVLVRFRALRSRLEVAWGIVAESATESPDCGLPLPPARTL